MSAGKTFFDTNVLLYMYGGDAEKRRRAQALFQQQAQDRAIVISTQVVQEFYAAGARKLAMPARELREIATALLDLPLVVLDRVHIVSAIENAERYRVSFWDGLILAAAQAVGAEVVYTEDLNDGQYYGAVRAQNPFTTQDPRS